jgi:hypothetical protein
MSAMGDRYTLMLNSAKIDPQVDKPQRTHRQSTANGNTPRISLEIVEPQRIHRSQKTPAVAQG